MIAESKIIGPAVAVVSALLLIGLGGCSEELGPEKMVVTRVNGFVREGRTPVASGWIEFYPIEGTVGNLCSARLHADGSFVAEHVAVGTNLVRLANCSISAEGARRVFGAYTSPIRRTIAADSHEPVIIDVVDEAIRLRGALSSGTTADSPPTGAAP